MSALVEALVAAQADPPCAIGKDAEGQIGTRRYGYLTLDKLIAETRPILTKHGLAIIQYPTYIERGDEAALPALRTDLRHVSGDVTFSIMPLYLTDKTMQGLGAAITYGTSMCRSDPDDAPDFEPMPNNHSMGGRHKRTSGFSAAPGGT